MATVHGDDITIGGKRLAVELLINMIMKRYEIQELGDRRLPKP